MSRNFLDEDKAGDLRAEDRARKYYNNDSHLDIKQPSPLIIPNGGIQ